MAKETELGGCTRIRDGIRTYFPPELHPNDGPDQLPLARARLAEVLSAPA
jgi:hypothetical protein